ncbi:hypothetical protein AMJ80_01500 [bacterium SM23_31]|nr:MAG: hypothetical protein AMJ80_01500 [bacterium SM23_31]
MKDIKLWLWLLLFGSLWGIVEVVVGEILFGYDVPYASVWLAVWALFILAVGRGVMNRAGTSTFIGAFAAVFKLVNASPNYCHLLAIFALGLIFDVFSTVLMKDNRRILLRCSLTGLLSAYGGRAFFALLSTYIMRYEHWVTGGSEYILGHIFVRGSIAALISAAVVPIGYTIGINGEITLKKHPRWAFAGSLVTSVFLWALVRIV